MRNASAAAVLLLGCIAIASGGCGKRSPAPTGQATPSGAPFGPPTALAGTPCGTDGAVHALAIAGNTLFLGGDFEAMGCPGGAGAIFDPRTGRPKEGIATPAIAGAVQVAVADPARPGGFYIGGKFERVGTTKVGYLARLLPNGDVDPTFDAKIDGNVSSIAVDRDVVYVAGAFYRVGGAKREHLAALDATTGALDTQLALEDTRGVESVALVGDRLYVAGRFEVFGGQKRAGLAAVDTRTAKVLPWSPKLDGRIGAIYGAEQTLYVLGSPFNGFKKVDGTARESSVAAFDARTGALTPFNPVFDRPPTTLLATKDSVYAAGRFDTVGGVKCDGVAVIDPKTGRAREAISGKGPSTGAASVLAVHGTTLLVAGTFDRFAERVRHRAAAVDLATKQLTAFDPSFNGDVEAVAVSGDAVFMGGNLSGWGTRPQEHLGALDLRTGQPQPLDVTADRSVSAMLVVGEELIVAGSFSDVGGHGRRGLAKLDLATRKVKDWSANIERGSVDAVAVAADGTIYVGGTFETVGGEKRKAIAAIDPVTARPTPFAPVVSGERFPRVEALALVGKTLFVAGTFTEVNGAKRKGLAALDAKSGALLDTTVDADGSVDALAVAGETVFVGGSFKKIGDTTSSFLASLDVNGALQPSVDAPIVGACNTLSVVGGLLLGGCRTGQSDIAAFEIASRRYLPLKVQLDWRGGVRALTTANGVVFAAGRFHLAGGEPRAHVVAVEAASGRLY